MNKEEIERLKREDILYDKTQKFGRTQFVRELARLEQENQQLKEKISIYEKTQTFGDYVETTNKVIDLQQENKQLLLENTKLYEDIDKAIKYIREKERNNCWIGQYDACDLIKILKGGDSNE